MKTARAELLRILAMKKMGSILLGLTFMFIICSQAGATTYTFTQDGFTGGETVTGWFVGTDSDGDGIIASNDGEITSAYFSVSGSRTYSKTFNFDEIYISEAFQLVYVLGSGSIGDDDNFWTDGISADGSGFVYAAGTPAVFAAGDMDVKGIFTDVLYSGTISSYTNQLVQVSGDLATVPEPATMMMLGLGLAGLAGLRRKFGK